MDLQQFEITILPLKNKVYRLAKTLLGDVTEAEDAVQDIYLKLWSVRAELDKADNITGFVLHIARNYCVDKLRQQPNIQYDVLSTSEHVIENQSNELSPYERTEQRDMVSAVKRLIEQLPEQQRIVIHLRDVEGMEMNEIVHITGLTENAIKVYLSRARQRIRESLTKQIID